MSKPALKRLLRDYNQLKSLEEKGELGFTIKLKEEDSLFVWWITINKFNEDSHLKLQFDAHPEIPREVTFEFYFPQDYPFQPPKVRVITPRFTRGKSYIIEGGAICIDTFTPKNWSAVFGIETCLYSVISLLNQDDLENAIEEGTYSDSEGEASLKKIKLYHPSWF
ncbi:hypothetical protein COU54_01420 [Candidatus Pacearchaeota archaeon CG10_big_fil_rev_8_21_14_0_10_31_24]|nr:MAG: hypothetical protein COU54_01420 [Candidatus Pacearchaeota archaeon CG10_big_fil_rev_8_21_14_0_10_31_24]